MILLTLAFLFFILITVCAKKDSWVRAIAYTLVREYNTRASKRCIMCAGVWFVYTFLHGKLPTNILTNIHIHMSVSHSCLLYHTQTHARMHYTITHTNTHTHAHTHTHTYAQKQTQTHANTLTHTLSPTHTHAHIHTFTHALTNMHTHTHTHTHTHHTHTHTHTHTVPLGCDDIHDMVAFDPRNSKISQLDTWRLSNSGAASISQLHVSTRTHGCRCAHSRERKLP